MRETLETKNHEATPDDAPPHGPALRLVECAESSAEAEALRLLMPDAPFEDDAREGHFQRTFAEVARRLDPAVFGVDTRDVRRAATEG